MSESINISHSDDDVNGDNNNDRAEIGVLDIIRKIKAGQLVPNSLSDEQRRMCVEHLTAEGLTVSEMAQILGCVNRTIQRDREKVRQANALHRDPKLGAQLAGQLRTEAETCIGQIRRAARGQDVPPGVKVEAQKACFDILERFIARLQSMGIVDSAVHKIHADLSHSFDDLPPMEQIAMEITRIEKIAGGDDQAAIEQVTRLKHMLAHVQVVQQVSETHAQLTKENTNDSVS